MAGDQLSSLGGGSSGWFRLHRRVVQSGTWARLGASARSVLIVLAEAIDDKDRGATGRWVVRRRSVRRIGELAGTSRRATFRALSELEMVGLLSRVRSTGGSHVDVAEFELIELPSQPLVTGDPGGTPRVTRVAPTGDSGGTLFKKGVKNHYQEFAAPASARKTGRRPSAKKATDPNHAALTNFFATEWHRRFGKKYPHSGGKDASATTAILGAMDGDLDHAKELVLRFLDDADAWLRGRHTLAIMRGQLSRYLEGTNVGSKSRGISGNSRYSHLVGG